MAKAVKKDFSKEEQELAQMREGITNPPAAENSDTESLPVETDEAPEPQPPVVSEQEPEQTPPEPTPEPSKEVAELSERAQKRYQELINARKQAEERAAQLEAERNSLLTAIAKPDEYPSEVTPQEYEQHVAKKAQTVVQETLRQERVADQRRKAQENFLTDLQTIEQKHPILNQDSPEYDKAFDEMVGDYFDAISSKNPNVRLVEVVDKFVNLRQKSAEAAKKEKMAKITKQASQQAIAPGGGETEPTDTLAKKVDRFRVPQHITMKSTNKAEAELAALREEIGTVD